MWLDTFRLGVVEAVSSSRAPAFGGGATKTIGQLARAPLDMYTEGCWGSLLHDGGRCSPNFVAV